MKIAKEALRLSFPVMVGYVFLGIAFGILCQQQGYSMLWAFLISLSVYAGSMQFISEELSGDGKETLVYDVFPDR